MINLNTKKIVIPIDFSETSFRAIKHGAFLAKRRKGDVILVYVLPKRELLDVILPAMETKNLLVITLFLEKRITRLAEDLSKQYGIKATGIVSQGNVASEIVRLAEEHKAGIIVMGTQGADSSHGLYLGSIAHRVVVKSEIPVLTTRSKAKHLGYSRILLPIDTSRHSRQKVNLAIQFADKFASHIHVLGLLDKNDEQHEYKLKVNLPQIEKMVKAKKLAFSSEIIKTNDRVKKTLIAAKKRKSELIVCMRDETNEPGSFMLGSYSHQLLNLSRIPILTIPPEIHPENIEQDSIGGMW